MKGFSMSGFSMPSISLPSVPKITDVVKTDLQIPKIDTTSIKSNLKLPEIPDLPELPKIEMPGVNSIDTSTIMNGVQMPDLKEISNSIDIPTDVDVEIPSVADLNIPEIQLPDMSAITGKLGF